MKKKEKIENHVEEHASTTLLWEITTFFTITIRGSLEGRVLQEGGGKAVFLHLVEVVSHGLA